MNTFRRVREMVDGDPWLLAHLREWHRMNRSQPYEWQDKPFEKWMKDLVVHLSDMVPARGDGVLVPTGEDILSALRVNAVGDFMALREAERADLLGFFTDVSCYVSDGVVYSSIWIASGSATDTESMADDVKARMESTGYAADVYVEEEDPTEATVNAQIDFCIYSEMEKRWMGKSRDLCSCDSCGKVTPDEVDSEKGEGEEAEKEEAGEEDHHPEQANEAVGGEGQAS